MRKIFKTIVVASLATLAMPLSASTMQTYTASSDSIYCCPIKPENSDNPLACACA